MQRLFRVYGYVLTILALAALWPHSDGRAHAQANTRPLELDMDSSGTSVEPLDVALNVRVGQDSNGRWYSILENSQIKVRYAYFLDNTAQTAIVDFIIKAGGLNEDQAGNYLDATADRGLMTNATITYDGLDRKTARLEWDNGGKVQDISIFPDSTYIKIDYIKYGVNIVDMGSSGGSTSGGVYQFYGAENWIRGYVLNPDSYYNRYPGDGLNDPADGGSLNYQGYFIGGPYRSSNDRGYARLMPVSAVDIIKLLANRGFVWYPHYQRTHRTYTGYLYAVTSGQNDMLATGQESADQTPLAHTLTVSVAGGGLVTRNPNKTNYNPGEVVTLTATADTGWTFTGWSGDLVGGINPAQVTMTGNKVITATFALVPVTGGQAIFLPLIMRGQP